jgi:hypothetical protein
MCRASEKKMMAEAAAKAAEAALRKADVICGAATRSAPDACAPVACQVCGVAFPSKTKVC